MSVKEFWGNVGFGDVVPEIVRLTSDIMHKPRFQIECHLPKYAYSQQTHPSGNYQSR